MSEEATNLLEPEIRHGYAQVGDVRLHYAECGEGERLVVLLHGFPECWYSWRHQLKALGRPHPPLRRARGGRRRPRLGRRGRLGRRAVLPGLRLETGLAPDAAARRL